MKVVKCEFSSFTVKSQQINIQPQVDRKHEKPDIMSTLKTNMPLTLPWYHYVMDITKVVFWTRNVLTITLPIISNC